MNRTPIYALAHRPEIDGLRALAIGAVTAFHFDVGLPGGFVGVDVFFVISGYLILGMISRECAAGRFELGDFLCRRLLRLAPALVVVTASVLLAGWFLLLPKDLARLGTAVVFQSSLAANVFYGRQEGYFSPDAHEQPLLHTWSLAVEEQFYLLIPILVWCVARWNPRRLGMILPWLIIVGFCLSLGWSLYLVRVHSGDAFYLLPGRIWEFLAGGLVLLVPATVKLSSKNFLRAMTFLLAVAMVLVPMLVLTSNTPFPGSAAIIPCFGTACILWLISRSTERGTLFELVLRSQPMVFMGRISYSLYLWHWPLLAFTKYISVQELTISMRASVFTLSLLLATASWRWIEVPFRTIQRHSDRRIRCWFLGGSLATMCLIAHDINLRQGLPSRFPARYQDPAQDDHILRFHRQVGLEDVTSGRLLPLGSQGTPPTVLVWGDSHAMAALPAVEALLIERRQSGLAAVHSATAPVCNWYLPVANGLGPNAVEFSDEVIDFIRRNHIPDVILIAYWATYVRDDVNRQVTFSRALRETIQKIREMGARPWVVLDVPVHAFDVPRAVSMPYFFVGQDSLEPGLEDLDPTILRGIVNLGGLVIDPKPQFLNPVNQRYRIEISGRPLYTDRHHLSRDGALEMLLPLFRQKFSSALETPLRSDQPILAPGPQD